MISLFKILKIVSFVFLFYFILALATPSGGTIESSFTKNSNSSKKSINFRSDDKLLKDVSTGKLLKTSTGLVEVWVDVHNNSSFESTFYVEISLISKDGKLLYQNPTIVFKKIKSGELMGKKIVFYEDIPLDAVVKINSVRRVRS